VGAGSDASALFAHAGIFDNLLGTLAGSLLVRTAAVGMLLAGRRDFRRHP